MNGTHRERTRRDVRTTGWLAIALLALATVGCASGPVNPEPLVSVTGHWEGTYEAVTLVNPGGPTRQIRMTLRQNGSKVKGRGVLSTADLSVDGGVDGEVFAGHIGDMRFTLTVTGNEMKGRAEGGFGCPCRLELRRAGAAE